MDITPDPPYPLARERLEGLRHDAALARSSRCLRRQTTDRATGPLASLRKLSRRLRRPST